MIGQVKSKIRPEFTDMGVEIGLFLDVLADHVVKVGDEMVVKRANFVGKGSRISFEIRLKL